MPRRPGCCAAAPVRPLARPRSTCKQAVLFRCFSSQVCAFVARLLSVTRVRDSPAGTDCGLRAARPDPYEWPLRLPASSFGAGAAPLTIAAAPAPHARMGPWRSDSALTLTHLRLASCAPGGESPWPLLASGEACQAAPALAGLGRSASACTLSSGPDDFGSDIDLDEPAPSAPAPASCRHDALAERKAAPRSADGRGCCEGAPGALKARRAAAWESAAGLDGAGEGAEAARLALFMAQCAALAYEAPGAAEAAAARWGFAWEGGAAQAPDGAARSASWRVPLALCHLRELSRHGGACAWCCLAADAVAGVAPRRLGCCLRRVLHLSVE
jgi:hypothetical protein